MEKNLYLLLIILFFSACKQQTASENGAVASAQQEVKKLQAELAFYKKEIQQLEKQNSTSGLLTHTVFLKLKKDLAKHEVDGLKSAINALKEIDFLQNFHLGRIADTDDTRFISDHDLFFSFQVKNMEEMDAYQKHDIHLALKKVAGERIAAAPKVYDYWVE